MSQKISDGSSTSTLTEDLISKARKERRKLKILLHPTFLDDEKLTESEKMQAIQKVFDRNIRTMQIDALAGHLACVLDGIQPPNLLVYGPSGAGKSVTCLHVLESLKRLCHNEGTPFHYCYIDLTTPKTCFGALNEIAISLNDAVKRYKKGMAKDQMRESIVNSLNRLNGFVCLLLDEADNVTTDPDGFLVFLAKTLPRQVQARLSYVFVTNRIEWERTLDPRIFSVLKKQDIIFQPYDAEDIVQILDLRVQRALDKDKVFESAIRKIAAYASRETGDARKAVELLTRSVKIAESTTGVLTDVEVDSAHSALEIDKTEELVASLAYQQKLALLSCCIGLKKVRGRLSTGDAYQVYIELCHRQGTRSLTQRRFSDMVSFLDVYGLVNAKVYSRGRYGKHRELSSALPEDVIERLLKGV